MKNLLVILIAALLWNSAEAGELRIIPEDPGHGAKMTFSYIPSDNFAEDFDQLYRDNDTAKYYLFLYEFTDDDQLPVARKIELTPGDTGRYYVMTDLGANTVFALAKVGRNYRRNIVYDDNHGKYWDFKVYRNGQPVAEACLKSGLSYLGNMPENCSRSVDYGNALAELERETRLYPQNTAAKIGLTQLQYDLKKITQDEFIDRLNTYTDNYFDRNNESAVRAISRALRTLNRAAEARNIEQQYVDAHPRSALAREHHVSRMSSAETLNEFSQLVVDYVNVFPNAENLYRIYSALVTGYLQVGRVQDLLGLLRRLQGVPPTVYTQIAEEIAERQDLMRDMSDSEQLEYAKDVYALGLNMIIDNTYDHMQHRPQYFTDIAWTYEGMMLEGAVYEAGGDIYYLAGEFAQANDFYINAIIIQSENATDVLYQNCINSYLKTGSPDTAYTIASRAIRYSKTNDFVYAVHDSLYHFQPDTSRAYSAVISELKNEARDRRTTHLKYALIREPAPVFTVSDPSGRVYEIGDFRGRIMISAFWASWCGPCRIMLSDLNEFYVGKKDNPDLVIAGINVWEQTTSADEDVDEFLNENDFDFPIYIDKTGILPQKFNLSGLPVAAIIDQQGFLRYKTQGYPGPEKFRQRLEDVIFLLESDK